MASLPVLKALSRAASSDFAEVRCSVIHALESHAVVLVLSMLLAVLVQVVLRIRSR